MSDRLNDDQVAWMANNPAKVSTWVNMLVEPLAREVQARRLSDITTPICPDCQGDEWMLEPCPEDPEGAHCEACTDGHIPPKVWVGMLTDTLRAAEKHITYAYRHWSPDDAKPIPLYDEIDRILALADSVTPKEGT